MTNEEKTSAIQSVLKYINDDGYIDIANHGCPDDRNELEVIKEALEKQIPKKPIADRELEVKTCKCPNCNCSLGYDFEHVLYCQFCGQALDWSDA